MKKKEKKKQSIKHGPSSWPFKPDSIESFSYYPNAFSKEECKKIIKLGKQFAMVDGAVRNGVEPKARLSKINWMWPSAETDWIFRRLTDIVTGLNNEFHQFDLFGFIEGLQFTYYKAPDNFYTKHIDTWYKGPVRKLSMSLLLSDPDTYEGGDLKLHTGGDPTCLPKEQGKLLAFPSYTLHEVTPVTKGHRYSLVGWITGPQFK